MNRLMLLALVLCLTLGFSTGARAAASGATVRSAGIALDSGAHISSATAGALTLTPTPTITGTRAVGNTLTAVNGKWDSGVTFSYAWYRGTTLITSVTTSTYVLGSSDAGETITVSVTGSKPGYTSVTRQSVATTAIVPGTLRSTPTPVITGTTRVGQTLTAALNGQWDSGVKLAYAWYRDSALITSATGSTYVLEGADFNQRIRVKVTGSKPGYTSVSRQASPTSAISAGTLTLTSKPKITGKVAINDYVYAEAGTWDSGVTFTYAWYKGNMEIKYTDWSPSWVLTNNYGCGWAITVKVTGSKPGYTPVTHWSEGRSVGGCRA